MTWFSVAFPFRRKIRLTAPSSPVPINHPVTCVLTKANLVDKGKMKSDYSDLIVVYNDTKIGRQVTEALPAVLVEFETQTSLAADQVVDNAYYIYYGSTTTVTQPIYTPAPWPISVAFDGSGVTYTKPGEDWVDGVSNIRHAKAVFIFYGTKVRLVSNLGKNQGIAEVQLDNGDWEPVDLYSRGSLLAQPVYTKDNLEPTDHVIRVRVAGLQNPASSGTTVNIVRFDYMKNVSVTDEGEEINDFTWSSYLGGV